MSCLIYTIAAKCGRCGEVHLWEKPSLVDVLDGAEIAAGQPELFSDEYDGAAGSTGKKFP